jgi:hypothetical protein
VERTTIAGETEELGENLPSATLSHHKSHMPRSGFSPTPLIIIIIIIILIVRLVKIFVSPSRQMLLHYEYLKLCNDGFFSCHF